MTKNTLSLFIVLIKNKLNYSFTLSHIIFTIILYVSYLKSISLDIFVSFFVLEYVIKIWNIVCFYEVFTL